MCWRTTILALRQEAPLHAGRERPRRGRAARSCSGTASPRPAATWRSTAGLPDHPGSLAKLLADLADLGANVLEVGPERLAPRLHVDEVEVVLQVETRGPEHCAEVIGALRAAGYVFAFA